MNSQQNEQTHLEFYQQHQIAPVRYNLEDETAHLERRSSLYLKLGVPPLAFRSQRVLEVAAGCGHNSLYLAHTLPKNLVLLEPNPTGVEHICEAYSKFQRPHTIPEIIPSKLEDYHPTEPFDIVLCENWLGTSPHELSLLQKLANLVVDQGILLLTTVSPIGFIPNLLRRFLAVYAVPLSGAFETRTESLVRFFGPHLDTLKAMTRNKTDWVQDNMINPAYFGICLSMPQVIQELGEKFAVIGSFPSIAEDWRWFKNLHGVHRQFNEHFLSEYWTKAHNFLDYRAPITIRDPALNMELEKKAIQLLQAIEMHEKEHNNGGDIAKCIERVLIALDAFTTCVPAHLSSAICALNEMQKLIEADLTDQSLWNMVEFPALFGRETVYLSLLRNGVK